MRAGFLISEVRIGLRRNLTMTFAVIVTTAISLSLLGIGLLSNAQVNALQTYRVLAKFQQHQPPFQIAAWYLPTGTVHDCEHLGYRLRNVALIGVHASPSFLHCRTDHVGLPEALPKSNTVYNIASL